MANMSRIEEQEYWVPEHVRVYLRSLGFVLPLESMEGYIRTWQWQWPRGAAEILNGLLQKLFEAYCVHRIHIGYA